MMSAYHGAQGKGAAKLHRAKKRAEAEARAAHKAKVEKVSVSEALADIFDYLSHKALEERILRREGE